LGEQRSIQEAEGLDLAKVRDADLEFLANLSVSVETIALGTNCIADVVVYWNRPAMELLRVFFLIVLPVR
jgi:hypothetical protein